MAWTKYKEIKYASAGIPSANLTDFPAPVWITTDSDIVAELSGGGGIKFTSADGATDLAFGLYPGTNLAAGTVQARVKLSPLTAASVGDVIARIYYSSAESTTQNKSGTVSNGYVLFMPLEEDPSGSSPQMFDWVSNSNVGASQGSMTSGDLVAGKVANGLDLDGSNDYISVAGGGGLNNLQSGTIEITVKTADNSGTKGYLSRQKDGSFSNQIITHFRTSPTNAVARWLPYGSSVITGSRNIGDANFHAIAVRYASGDHKLYVDGVADGTSSTAGTINNDATVPLGIGAWYAGGASYSQAIIDEFRASSVDRSADWLAYAYTTDFNLASLWTLSAEQGAAAATRRGDLLFVGNPGVTAWQQRSRAMFGSGVLRHG